MGTGTCSPDLDFPSVTVVRSPESVRIGGRGGREDSRAQRELQSRAEHSTAGHHLFAFFEYVLATVRFAAIQIK